MFLICFSHFGWQSNIKPREKASWHICHISHWTCSPVWGSKSEEPQSCENNLNLKTQFFKISLFLKFHGRLEWLIDRKVGLLPLGVVSLDVLFPGNTCVSLFTCALHGCFYFLSVSISYTCPYLPLLVASVSYLLHVRHVRLSFVFSLSVYLPYLISSCVMSYLQSTSPRLSSQHSCIQLSPLPEYLHAKHFSFVPFYRHFQSMPITYSFVHFYSAEGIT